jgi:hypothetical protein
VASPPASAGTPARHSTAAANQAFVHAMDVTVLVGAGVALAGAAPAAVLCLAGEGAPAGCQPLGTLTAAA